LAESLFVLDPRPVNRSLTTAVVILLAIAGLVGQVASISHALSTAHGVCEHGEIVHAEGAVESVSVVASTQVSLQPLPETDHEHDCALLNGVCESEDALPESGWLQTLEPPRALALVRPDLEASFLQDRLHVAPKTSPPGPSTIA